MADEIDEQVTAHIREILHLAYGAKGKASKEPATDASTSKTPNQAPSDTPSDTPSEAPSDSPNDSPMNPSATSKTTGQPSIVPTSDTHFPVEGGEITSESLEGDILSQEEGSHILEEYFEESAVDSGPVNDTEGRERCPTSTVECTHQRRLLESTRALDTLDLNPTVVLRVASLQDSVPFCGR